MSLGNFLFSKLEQSRISCSLSSLLCLSLAVTWLTVTAPLTHARETIRHIATETIWDEDGQHIQIRRPEGSATGDLLLLVIHRTDDVLPYAYAGWKRLAECYKENNGYECASLSDCSDRMARFCKRFRNRETGLDLAQVVLYRVVQQDEPKSYTFDLNADQSGHPGWVILSALRGVDTQQPLRDWASRGCDMMPDSLFPSVTGQSGDLLVLSQSFDDAVAQKKFGAPQGTSTFGYVSHSDEAGFLFGGIVVQDGPTGDLKTRGDGASRCKDALIALTLKPMQSD